MFFLLFNIKKEEFSNILAVVIVSRIHVGIVGTTTQGTVISVCYMSIASILARGLTIRSIHLPCSSYEPWCHIALYSPRMRHVKRCTWWYWTDPFIVYFHLISRTNRTNQDSLDLKMNWNNCNCFWYVLSQS